MKEIKIRVPTLDDVMPKEFRDHMRNAAKEVLLAFRSIIDDRLKKLEKLEKGLEDRKLKKINID